MLNLLLNHLRSRFCQRRTKKALRRAGFVHSDHQRRLPPPRLGVECLEDRVVPDAGGWERINPLGSLMFQRQESGAFGSGEQVAILSEDFESGTLGAEWTTFSSTPNGRVEVSDVLGAPAHDGAFHLAMDRTPAGTTNLNEAVLTVDLSGASNVDLTFWHKDVNDEDTALPATFTGHAVGDGVSFSADGTTWHRLVSLNNLNSPNNVYTQFTFDLDAAAAAVGVAPGADFQIKFQQFDNFPFISDGRTFDDVMLTTDAPPVDVTEVFLEGGQKLTLVAAPDDPASTLTVRVLSPSNALLAEATAAGPGETVALQTIDITGDGTYRVEVTGDVGSTYAMTLYRNAAVEGADTDDGAELDATGSFVPLGSGRYGIVGSFEGAAPPAALRPVVWGVQPDTGNIIKIDPATGMILGAFSTPDNIFPAHNIVGLTIAEGGNSLLYVNARTGVSTIWRLDPDTGSVLSTEFMPPPSSQVFRAGLSFETGPTNEFIFGVDDGAGIDRQVDFGGPISKHVTGAITFPGAIGGDDNGRQFAARGNGIEEYDPFVPNTILNVFPSPTTQPAGMAFDGVHLYVSDLAGNLFTLNPDTGQTIALVSVPGGELVGLGAKRVGLPAPPLQGNELIANGSFETGDFSGWTTVTTGTPFRPWQVTGAGQGDGFNMAPTAPRDGSFVAWNGFDGVGPLSFQMFQDVTIAAGTTATLTWQDRVQWNFTLGAPATLPRTYEVQVRNPGTNAVLTTLFSLSTGTQATNPTGDTGWQTHTADLSAFAGSTVRLFFVEQIPQASTGPGQIEFDAISLIESTPGGGEQMFAAVGRGSSLNPGGVLVVDQTSAAGLLLGDPVTPGGLTGLDFASDGTLFGSSINGPLGNRVSRLVRIDPDTGGLISSVPILVGNTPISIGDLAIQPGTDVIFGLKSSSDAGAPGGSLFTINPSTGAATFIGSTNQNRGGGLAFAPDGTLYFLEFNELHTLNPNNAAILSTQLLNFGGHDGLGIRRADGALFATRAGAGTLGDEIRIINPAAGTSTLIGRTMAGNASDLAFRPAPDAGPDVDEYLIDLTGKAGRAVDILMTFATSGGPADQFQDTRARQNNVFFPNVLTFNFNGGVPAPAGDATLRVDAVADLDASFEFLTLNAEGLFTQQLFVMGGAQQQPVSTTVTIPRAVLEQLAADGTISFTVTPSSSVNNLGNNSLTLNLSYAAQASPDATLELLAPDGTTVLATGAPGAENFGLGIQDFVVPADGVYTVRVSSGGAGQYGIVVTESLVFDTEPNGLARTRQLITNGDFETGNLMGWTVVNTGSGTWQVNNGTFNPNGPAIPRPPIAGNFDAVTSQSGPSTQMLSEAITVPEGITAATLSWSDRIQNFAPQGFQDPNQEWRVVIRNASGGLIQEIFSTDPGDPTQQVGPNARSFDVTALLQSLEGQQVRVSFELDNNLFFFNTWLDNVSLEVETAGGPPRGLDRADGALGYLSAGAASPELDVFAIELAAGETVGFRTLTPFDGPADGLNTLDPALQVLAPDGTVVASALGGAPDGKNVAIVSFTAPADGVYRLVLRDETGGGTGEYVLLVNRAPVITDLALSSAAISENDTVTLTGSFTDFNADDTHTVLVNWGDGTTGPAAVNPLTRTFTASHQYLDDGPASDGSPSFVYSIGVTVTDNHQLADTTGTTITVNNVNPQITTIASSATFADLAEEGEAVTVTATFTDVGTLDTHTAVIDWGDGTSPVPAAVTQGSGSGSVTASHAYANGGVFIVTLTVTDDDTGTAVQTTTAVVIGAGVNNGVLQVVGTNGGDQVTLNQQGNGLFKVHADFFSEGAFRTFGQAGVQLIEIYLGDGDDHATIAGNVATPAILDGGAGNDHLKAGAGPAVLLGGAGEDMLIGGKGRNILIGGTGGDRLVGGRDEDLLIGGWTAFDNNHPALLALLAEWNDPTRGYEERVDNIRTGSGPVLDGTGFKFEAGVTVFEDGDGDKLTGAAGRDWFFFDPFDDVLTGKKGDEEEN